MHVLKYIAHTKDGKTFLNEEECQSLSTHLYNVAILAREFAAQFEAEEIGYVIGLLHDIGKYQQEFQDRIRGSKVKVDHSIAGALISKERYGDIGDLYGMVIAGHHTGLLDSGNIASKGDGTYYARINSNKSIPDSFKNAISLPAEIRHKKLKTNLKYSAFSLAVYIKMLYSALVDADWTDTEEYITDVKRKSVNYYIDELFDSLMKSIPSNNGSYINNIRAAILNDCLAKSKENQGLYTLTVPTGGGKTLSSLAFALNHAKKHDLKRVIYVIPYTSIIEQNANVIAGCIGAEYVLEHHSNVEFDNDSDKRMKWASENWDIPVIVTTNVQFFESFFSNKPSRNRKLHNIASSVVIFDEAQMLPVGYLSPCMYAISELVVNYKVTAVLCSATQPEISRYKYDNVEVNEIVQKPNELAEKLKRVNYTVLGKKTDEQILDITKNNEQALIILNSRKHAFWMYKMAVERHGNDVFHLSTLMYPKHRRKVLNEIRGRLKNRQRVIVVSTQLIEAGVDVDFPLVIRSIAGIDSIIQAGGRANRERKLKKGNVFVFEPDSEVGKIPRSILNTASIGKEVIDMLGDKAFELEGISEYFNQLYHSATSQMMLDTKGILNEYEKTGSFIKVNFESVSNKFKMIESNTYNIVVAEDEHAIEMIGSIRSNSYTTNTIRALGQYTVSVYENEFARLCKEHVIEKLDNGINLLNNNNYYSCKVGIEIFTEDNKNAECYDI